MELHVTLLILKATLTPLLIAAATLIARRWGPAVGGWAAGLPLTSGPVSVFLAVEQDPAFAAHAACGTLLGLVAVGAFCVAYARSARGSTWVGPTTLGLGLYSLVIWVVSLSSCSLFVSTVLVLPFLGVAFMGLGVPALDALGFPAPQWDLPVRMAAATAMVLLITGAANSLGAKWSGLLSPFPVFACVMAIFSHKNGGPGAAHRLLRGVIVGSFGFASFFVVVGLVVERVSLVLAYTLATGVALAVNGFSLVTLLRKHRAG
jgi:uncharacterized membrane protein (GlpM family)